MAGLLKLCHSVPFVVSIHFLQIHLNVKEMWHNAHFKPCDTSGILFNKMETGSDDKARPFKNMLLMIGFNNEIIFITKI